MTAKAMRVTIVNADNLDNVMVEVYRQFIKGLATEKAIPAADPLGRYEVGFVREVETPQRARDEHPQIPIEKWKTYEMFAERVEEMV